MTVAIIVSNCMQKIAVAWPQQRASVNLGSEGQAVVKQRVHTSTNFYSSKSNLALLYSYSRSLGAARECHESAVCRLKAVQQMQHILIQSTVTWIMITQVSTKYTIKHGSQKQRCNEHKGMTFTHTYTQTYWQRFRPLLCQNQCGACSGSPQ